MYQASKRRASALQQNAETIGCSEWPVFMCVLTRSVLDQRNLFPVEVLLKPISINNQKTLGGARWQTIRSSSLNKDGLRLTFASNSVQFLCCCVILLRFNGNSYKLWLWLASKKGICQASSATLTHVQYFISQVVLAILLDHPCKAALPCLPPAVLLREGGSCEFLQSLVRYNFLPSLQLMRKASPLLQTFLPVYL